MANVIFKRGNQANLPAVNAAQDGVFYLTEDTGRLYVGQGTKLVELNKSITVVSNANQLPQNISSTNLEVKGNEVAPGQFYYVNAGADSVSGNILAVCSDINSSTGKITWVQVNPDTNTDHNDNTWITSATATKVVDEDTNQIDVTLTINGSTSHPGINNNTETATPITATFSLTQEDIGKVVVDTEVGLAGSVSGNDAIISTTGTGSKNTYKATFTEGTGINFSTSSGKIKIDADTFNLSSAANSNVITLTKTNGSTSSTQTVTFDAGTALSVSGTTAGHIQYSHSDVSNTATTAADIQLAPASTATVVTGVTVNAQGHVTAVETRKLTAKDTLFSANSINANSNGDLSFDIKNLTTNTTTSASATKVLYHDIKIDNSTTRVYNQGNLGTFYSASKVDELINTAVAGLNAMTYKGTVGTSGATTSTLPTSVTAGQNVKIGDTYMASTSGTFAGKGADKGDLFIATGTETNGVITGAVTWELVPAGDDVDTTYTFGVTNGSNDASITSKASTSSSTDTIAKIKGGTAILVSASGSDITIAHNVSGANKSAGQSTSATLGYSDTFTVPYITVDAQGHVTAAENKVVTLPASVDSKYALSTTAPNSNEANIVLTASGSSSGTTSAIIKGGTAINVALDGTKIKISHTAALATGTAGQAYGASSTTALNAQGTFKVPQVTVDAQGHVTSVKEFTLTLPEDKDTKYQLRPTTVTATGTTASTSGVATATIKMSDTTSADSNQSTAKLIVKSNSLNVTKVTESSSDAINVDLIWGSF